MSKKASKKEDTISQLKKEENKSINIDYGSAVHAPCHADSTVYISCHECFGLRIRNNNCRCCLHHSNTTGCPQTPTNVRLSR